MFGMKQINLNGIMIEVDEDTASMLERDLVFRENYEKAVRKQLNLSEILRDDEGNAINNSQNNAYKENKTELVPEDTQLVWCSKKPSPRDIQATYTFLELRAKYASEFDDKKNTKNTIWQKIVIEMNNNNFFVGLGSEATERCRKKIANLQSAYMKYQDERRKTGQGKVQKPPFYDELDQILGSKDKVTPSILIDRVSVNNINPTVFEPVAGPSTEQENKRPNKYESVKTTSKPDQNVEKNKLLKELI
ncbi:uncharacterized protein LOC126744120 [Anthonomus grandis grandis]|uniref:uncharacterized protein LOC126744120 n=1 Tax=Anthonomus grandis grandis TaxID=2921223 RepID=UPI002166B8F7|nr:uncharacterized protein LOC126744120 [Anthonomus grandis grandis]